MTAQIHTPTPYTSHAQFSHLEGYSDDLARIAWCWSCEQEADPDDCSYHEIPYQGERLRIAICGECSGPQAA